MRTTITLEEDVASLIASEQARTGDSFKVVVNRLLRRGSRAKPAGAGVPSLPELPGRPILDIRDVSKVLVALDDERRVERSLP